MNKSNLIIIGSIIILVGLIIGYYSFSKPESNDSVDNVPCSDEYREALNKSDVTICESVTGQPGEHCRDICIKAVAYQKGEPELCQLINLAAGSLSNDIFISTKDMCYIHLAGKLDDVSLCDNVETDWAKTNCPLLYNI